MAETLARMADDDAEVVALGERLASLKVLRSKARQEAEEETEVRLHATGETCRQAWDRLEAVEGSSCPAWTPWRSLLALVVAEPWTRRVSRSSGSGERVTLFPCGSCRFSSGPDGLQTVELLGLRYGLPSCLTDLDDWRAGREEATRRALAHWQAHLLGIVEYVEAYPARRAALLAEAREIEGYPEVAALIAEYVAEEPLARPPLLDLRVQTLDLSRRCHDPRRSS
jgi:hypothetical protein